MKCTKQEVGEVLNKIAIGTDNSGFLALSLDLKRSVVVVFNNNQTISLTCQKSGMWYAMCIFQKINVCDQANVPERTRITKCHTPKQQ